MWCVQISRSHTFGASKWSPWEAELHSGESKSLLKSLFHLILQAPFPEPTLSIWGVPSHHTYHDEGRAWVGSICEIRHIVGNQEILVEE